MGTSKAFPLPPVVRSVLMETLVERLPHFRDSVTGEIHDKALTRAIIAAVDGKHPDIARQGRAEAWSVAVYQLVREYVRTSKSHYAIHDQEHHAAERRVKSRQRRMVTFRDHTGQMVTKDRAYLRKDELPLVRIAYERLRTGADDVIAWVDAVWEQMHLRGLGDDAIVADVLEDEAA